METKGNLEDTLFKLDLIRHGDIQDADGETLGVERLIEDVKSDLERAVAGPVEAMWSLPAREPR